MKPLVSIIIAVYNSEIWLPRCLRSAISQTLEHIEIILIDDGSTDDSLSICNEFAVNDPRIRVFHQQNCGICATRQFGLDHAQGEYLIFLDSDDFVSPTIYEKLYSKAKECNADIAACDWYSVYGSSMYREGIKIQKWDSRHLLHALVQDQPTYPTVYLCRRSIFERLSVGFPNKKVSYGEDTMMMVALLNAGITSGNDELTLCHVSEPLYYYDRTINPGSLMKMSRKEMTFTRLNLWSEIGAEIHSDTTKKALYNRLVYYLFASVLNNFYSADEFQEQYASWLPDIKQYASGGIKKRIVCQAIEGKISIPLKSKCMVIPILLQEKWVQFYRKYKALPVPSELAAL